MTAETKPAARGTIATVVATAAVTLAIGVTAAALGGYLVPAGERVVPVPIAPDTQAEPPASAPEMPSPVILAAYPTDRDDEYDDDDDGHRHEGHHEDEHDDD